MGKVEGQRAEERAEGWNSTSRRAGGRSDSRHATNATTTTSIWASTILPSARRTTPKPPPSEHRRPRRCHLIPNPTWAPTARSSHPHDPHSRASPIFDMGEHNPQSCFLPQCRYHRRRQRRPPIPIPARSRTTQPPYDHHLSTTPVLDTGESDGGCSFHCRILEWVGGCKQEGGMEIGSPMANEECDRYTLSGINVRMDGVSNAPTIMVLRPP